MIVFEGLLSPRRHLAIDDGGIRVLGKDGRYVPFSLLEDAELEISMLGVALLRLIRKDGVRETLRIRTPEALDAHAEILRHIGVQATSATLPDATRVAFERGHRSLDAWLASLAHWAQGEGYRSAAFDHEIAKGVLVDARAPADIRGACAFTLLSTGQEEDLAAVARAFAERALPPVVVVAARLGRGGAALVPDDMVLEAIDVLPAEDVVYVTQALVSTGHDDEAHVHEVMGRVKQAALREAQARVPAQRHKAFHARALGGYAAEQGVSRFR